MARMRKQLDRRRSEEKSRILEDIRRDEFDRAVDHLKRYELLGTLRSVLPAPWYVVLGQHAIVGVVAGVVAWASTTLCLPHTKVVGTISTTEVILHLPKAHEFIGAAQLQSDPLVLRGVGSLHIGRGLLRDTSLVGVMDVRVSSGATVLRRLSIGAGCLVVVSIADSIINVDIGGARVAGALDLAGAVDIDGVIGQHNVNVHSVVSIPEELSFSGEWPDSPLRLTMRELPSDMFAYIASDSIGLTRNVYTTMLDRHSATALISGAVSFPEAATEATVQEGDSLIVTKYNGIVQQLMATHSEMRLAFAGKCQRLSLSHLGVTKRLNPSIWEIGRHAVPSNVWVGALVFVWSLLLRGLRFLRWGLGAFLLFAGLVMPAKGMCKSDGLEAYGRWRSNAVFINATRLTTNGDPVVGTGFVIGQVDHNTVCIVTAAHTMFGAEYTDSSIITRVSFSTNVHVDSGLVLAQRDIALDLAFLFVHRPWSVVVAKRCLDPRKAAGQAVRFIGGTDDLAPSDAMGEVRGLPVNGQFRVADLGSPDGASGAPVVTKRGVVGMLSREGSLSAYVTTKDSIRAFALRNGLPWDLVRSRQAPWRTTLAAIVLGVGAYVANSVAEDKWVTYENDPERPDAAYKTYKRWSYTATGLGVASVVGAGIAGGQWALFAFQK